MSDALIAGEPVARWEWIMHEFADGLPQQATLRGLRAEPIPPQTWAGYDLWIRYRGHPAIIWHDESPWPEMRVSGPRDEDAGYADWR